MKYFLLVLLTPSCWLQNGKYSAAWDSRLRALMKTHRFVMVDRFTAKLDDVEIWVQNYPYSCMEPYQQTVQIRPRRRTILEAYEKLIKDTLP